ncbi:MAG: NACHT domain-containing protein [Deltaproteobacteria bacterium]|nr:NACHT domain-containing protein [Deltaproteobacteria bacterium]
MPTLRAELESLLHRVVEPVELDMALRREPWAESLARSLPPAKHTPPEEWFSKLTQLTDQHGVEGELLRLLETLRPARAAEFQALAARFAAGTIRHNLPDDPPTPLADPRDRYAFLLRERVGALPDVFQVAGGPATVESVYVAVRLSGESSALDCEAEAAFGGAHLGAQRHIGDRTGRRVGPEQPEPLETVLRRPHTRWVLLGDPGSGKTTVLRHAALKLLDDPDGRLPIYLTVAEIEDGIEPALRRLFERFGAADLTRWAHKEVLEGRAVLLLDGLDEVADLAAARAALLKLAVNVGKTTTLVIASRPTGYKPLSIDFVTLALCPLGDVEQRELLTRWVPDDARVTAALARLSRTPRLRRLAENPLLLTLAGLVLRAGKDVPQRRAELYEQALDVLIHRRHAPDGLVGPQLSAPGLAMELLGWAALRLHGQEGDVYPRGALLGALEADPRNLERLQRQWQDPERFITEVVTRSGLLIPDTGRVEGARAFSFPHRTFREFLAATALERDMGAWAAGLGERQAPLPRVEAVRVEAPKAPEPTALVNRGACAPVGEVGGVDSGAVGPG